MNCFVHTLRFLIGRRGRSGLWLGVALLGLVPLLDAGAIPAEPRTALVIGNGAYGESPLRNPVNDARDMAAKLRELGFQVIERLDANRQTMRQALRDFEQQLRQQRGVGLFYYAGHGVQLKGQNYLIPVGVDIRQEFEIPDEGVDADAVLRAMESAGNGLNIVILDACRNNPFARSLGSRGLTRMEGPVGTFIAYATAPGAISKDGTGRNSPYTQNLLTAMSTPGLSLEQVFKQVLVGVERETGGSQVPWVASSLRGEFYFLPPAPAAAPAPPAPAAASAPAAPPTAPPVAAGEPTPTAPPAQPPTGEPPAADAREPTTPLEPDLVTARDAGFAISRREISLEAYRRFTEANGPPPRSGGAGAGRRRARQSGAGDLAGGDGLRGLARPPDRPCLPAADRGGMGICRPGRTRRLRSQWPKPGMDLLRISRGIRGPGTTLRDAPAGSRGDSQRQRAGRGRSAQRRSGLPAGAGTLRRRGLLNPA